MNLAFENHPKIKLRLHIIVGALLFLNFVLIIARIADKGTPKTRSNTWGIVVLKADPRRRALQCLKAAIFLAYEVVTAHVERFKRWASAKAYMILNVIDTVFWLALFIISILGANGAHSPSSRALGGIVATISIILLYVSLYQRGVAIVHA
ncbi:hypothetical protein CNMCM5623_007281 [Aspergillus felis]|uniref:Uncharacterized protein n=1 Tax=Aspergillus felis TaxID=1287682 RepID=A0A8H6PW33_9EURO|nr:hypothetical protein CNMCM5623_007281 [Aspergillus felis]KAF7182982.1 hypothetical protein CNMCM7691_002726 [Aspergillus felis]